jgi:hypothetical protein
MRTTYPSVFDKLDVVNELHRLHEKIVLVPADKASNKIVFVCQKVSTILLQFYIK